MNEITAITPVDSVDDAPEPVNAVIAVNPQQMADAHATTARWIDAKLASAEADVQAAADICNTLRTYGLRPDTADAQLNKAARTVRYYEKVKAALGAGYYIVPPFPLQLFAIRTDRTKPARDEDGARWTNEQKARSLPAGDGHYVDPRPLRYQIGTKQEQRGDGKSHATAVYANTKFRDEIELPQLALKPQIIEEVGRALGARIFDALGIAPAYRSADPIICGQIKRPRGGVLTFFVAWWLDRDDL